ncbi:uncharacterized protein VTP21DRAFT_5334 [Calcarisporiella thermophila]|uniref:uncharacterized protein n=1 Tax=Calcarisporiella thermophila TaxID=911321 RepID=UPI00374206F0
MRTLATIQLGNTTTHYTLSQHQDEQTSDSSSGLSNNTRLNGNHSREAASPWVFLSSVDALCIQLRLNSISDLHRLLSAQLLIDADSLSNNQFQIDLPDLGDVNSSRASPIFVYYSFPIPIKEKDLQWPAKTTAIKRKLVDHLFNFYLGDCSYFSIHPNQASFLQSFYHDELEPALILTAVAYSALHIIIAHPQSPLIKKLHFSVREMLEQARRSLEDIFDFPSPQSVLAFLNMESCMVWLARFDDAHKFYSQAVIMALALQMDKGSPDSEDLEQIEFQKRIWAHICKRELIYRVEFGKPELISAETMKNSPKPTVNLNDSEQCKLTLSLTNMQIESTTKILEIKDFNWSLSDLAITHQLVHITSSLQRNQNELKRYIAHITQRNNFFNADFGFWSCWCILWRRFIQSDAPPGRLETDLMQQLRAKAFDEFIKGLSYCITALQRAVMAQIWCKDFPFICAHVVCENSRALDSLLSLKKGGILERWLAQRIIEALEEMKPRVYAKEELEMMNKSKLRCLAIKPTERY